MYKVSVTIGCFYHRRAGPMTVMIHNISQTISTVMEVFLMEGKQECSRIGEHDKKNIKGACHMYGHIVNGNRVDVVERTSLVT